MTASTGRIEEYVGDLDSALDAIGRALSFPAWYGRNLNALYDCLMDLSWWPIGPVRLVWPDSGVFEHHDEAAFRTVLEVLRAAAHDSQETVRPFLPELGDR